MHLLLPINNSLPHSSFYFDWSGFHINNIKCLVYTMFVCYVVYTVLLCSIYCVFSAISCGASDLSSCLRPYETFLRWRTSTRHEWTWWVIVRSNFSSVSFFYDSWFRVVCFLSCFWVYFLLSVGFCPCRWFAGGGRAATGGLRDVRSEQRSLQCHTAAIRRHGTNQPHLWRRSQ